MARRQCSSREPSRGRDRRYGKALGLLLLERFAFEKRDDFIEDGGITGRADVMRSDEGKPEEIVSDPRAHASAGLGMPPVLDIAFHELPRGRTQDVVARDMGRGVHESHHILQLVTKPVSAARLIKSRAAPEATAEGLINQPAIEQ